MTPLGERRTNLDALHEFMSMTLLFLSGLFLGISITSMPPDCPVMDTSVDSIDVTVLELQDSLQVLRWDAIRLANALIITSAELHSLTYNTDSP